MRQQEKQIMLQDGEIDHRQHAGIHLDTLYINTQKTALLGKSR